MAVCRVLTACQRSFASCRQVDPECTPSSPNSTTISTASEMTEPSGQAPIASTSTFSARFQHTLPHQNVLFRVTNGLVRAVKLTPGTTVQLGKLGKINVDRLTGLAYGTTYQLENDGGLVPAVVELQLDQGASLYPLSSM